MRIIEAFAQVAQLQPTAKLMVTGDGDHVPALHAWAGEQHLSERIIFAGRVPDDAIQDYLAAADIEACGYVGTKSYRVYENPFHRFFVLAKQTESKQ